MNRSTILIISAAFPFCVFSAPGQWQWQSPLPQGNSLLCLHFLTPDTGFVGGNNGAFLRTFDGGASWILSNLPGSRPALSLEFQSVKTGLALLSGSGGKCMLYHTQDGGNNWDSLTVSHPYSDAHVEWKGSTVFLSDSSSLRVSHDNGRNWSSCGSLSGLIASFSFPTADQGYVLTEKSVLGGKGNYSFFRSKNGCAQFDSVTLPDLDFITEARFQDAKSGFLMGGTIQSPFIFRSQDSGSTWSRAKVTGMMANVPRTISFVDSLTGYAFGPETVLKTLDGGATWSSTYIGDTINAALMDGTAIQRTLYFIGDLGLIKKSTDGGDSWKEISHKGNNSVNFNDVTFLDSRTGFAAGKAAWLSSEGKIWRTVDGGAHWDSLSIPKVSQLRSIRFRDAGLGMAVGDSGVILRSKDGGATWIDPKTISGEELVSVRFAGGNTAFVCGANGSIYQSDDGGISWREAYSDSHMNFSAMDFRGAKLGMVYGAQYNVPDIFPFVLTTTDGGATWVKTSFPVSNRNYSMLRPRVLHLGLGGAAYAVDMQGVLFLSGDSGAHWDSLADISTLTGNGGINRPNAILFTGADTGFIACDRRIVRTLDGGHTWAVQEIVTNPLRVNGLASDGFGNVIAVGDWGSVLRYDGGTTAIHRWVGTSTMPKLTIDEKGIHYHLDSRASVAATFFRLDGAVFSRIQGRVEESGDHVIAPVGFSGARVMDLSIGNSRHAHILVSQSR